MCGAPDLTLAPSRRVRVLLLTAIVAGAGLSAACGISNGSARPTPCGPGTSKTCIPLSACDAALGQAHDLAASIVNGLENTTARANVAQSARTLSETRSDIELVRTNLDSITSDAVRLADLLNQRIPDECVSERRAGR